MFSLIYISSAVRFLHPVELMDLLLVSQERNSRAGITGVLFYKDGNFTQVLEGEERDVTATFARIQVDPRHRQVITLTAAEIPERNFSSWAMGFEHVGYTWENGSPEYREFLFQNHIDQAVYEGSSATCRLLRRIKAL